MTSATVPRAHRQSPNHHRTTNQHAPRGKAKERSMANSSLAVISSELDRLPARFRGVRKSAMGLQHRTMRLTKRNPGRALLGAFAIGFVVSRLAKLVVA
jgi:hypothetical protein